MSAEMHPALVAHYHELWLKGGNRHFFVGKLVTAMRRALEGLPVERFSKPGDRLLMQLGPGADAQEAVERARRVLGVAYIAVAQPVERDFDAICGAAWREVEALEFSTFAVRAKRSDKTFPMTAMELERRVGSYVMERLLAQGRQVRVQLDDPAVTCRIEITPGPALVYARRIPGPGGLPANSGGRMLCLLSGGFDSAVAAYKMMKRGAHVTFAHFWGGGAAPGESSAPVARELVRKLAPYQLSARLHLIPFEPIQREIVRFAPEQYRILLYRRMMLRIAERLALRDRARALLTGDSLGQVASQTLQNMVAVGTAARLPVFRPLAGDDKQEIIALARQIGTYEISAEPFHDCCPVFMPRMPALFASPGDLDQAEAALDVAALVRRGVESATVERYELRSGQVRKASTDYTDSPDRVSSGSTRT
jgi:thiamine biosynthesis protein ThiI